MQLLTQTGLSSYLPLRFVFVLYLGIIIPGYYTILQHKQ